MQGLWEIFITNKRPRNWTKIHLHGIQSEISNKIEPTWLVWRTSMSPQTLPRYSISLKSFISTILCCILVYVSRTKRPYMRNMRKCDRCGHNCASNTISYTSKTLYCSRNCDCRMQLKTMPISGSRILIFDIVENCGSIGSLYPQSPFAAEIAVVDFL